MAYAPLHPRGRAILFVVTAAAAVVLVFGVFGRNPVSLIRESSTTELLQFGCMLSISVLVSVAAHYFIRRWILACVVAAISFAILLQIITLGYRDAFFIIAVFTGTVLGFAVASVVGLFFYFARHRKMVNPKV